MLRGYRSFKICHKWEIVEEAENFAARPSPLVRTGRGGGSDSLVETEHLCQCMLQPVRVDGGFLNYLLRSEVRILDVSVKLGPPALRRELGITFGRIAHAA